MDKTWKFRSQWDQKRKPARLHSHKSLRAFYREVPKGTSLKAVNTDMEFMTFLKKLGGQLQIIEVIKMASSMFLVIQIWVKKYNFFTHAMFNGSTFWSRPWLLIILTTPKEYRNKLKLVFWRCICISHLAWADFEIKVKQIAHSTLRFDQWNLLISKM